MTDSLAPPPRALDGGWSPREIAAELRAWVAANVTLPGLWLAVLVTLVFAVPGPADRVFWAVKLGREANAPLGAVFSIVDVLIVLTLVAGAWRVLKESGSIDWSKHVPIIALLALLNGLAIVSLARALGHVPTDQVGAAFKGAMMFARMAALFACVGLVVRKPADLRGLVVGLVLAAGALLANGALFSYQHRATLDRFTAGTFGNDLFASLFAITGLLLAAFTVMPWMGRLPRLATGIATIACIAGIAATGTRTGAVALIVGLGALAVVVQVAGLPGWRNTRAWLLSLVGAFAVSQVLAVVFLRSSALFGLILSEFSHVKSVPELESRLDIWRGTLRMIQAQPLFGLGPGQWEFYRHQYGVVFATFLDAHNAYLNIAADDGVLVLAVYVLIIGLAVWRGFSTFRALSAAGERRVAAADLALLGFIGIAVAAWLGTDLDNSGVLNLRAQIFFWCLLAILYRGPDIFRLRAEQ